MSTARVAVLIAVAALVGGCASEVVRSSAIVSPAAPSDPQRIVIAEDATVRSSSGYSRVLPTDSVWELRGTLPQGRVYKRVNDVFTVEGTHVHEAYLVVSGNRLVGYYLPVEQAYSPADPVSLKLK
jgi:hypothetical protein